MAPVSDVRPRGGRPWAPPGSPARRCLDSLQPRSVPTPAVPHSESEDQHVRTLAFFEHLSLSDVAWAHGALLEVLDPPAEISDRLASDFVLMRVVAYALQPRADDPEIWRFLRPYLTDKDMEQLELASVELGDPDARDWLRAISAIFFAVWNAQDVDLAGDPRPFSEIVVEFMPQRVLSEDGRHLESRCRYPAGGWVTLLATLHDDGSGDIEYVLEDVPEAIDAGTLQNFADDLAVHCLQLWHGKPAISDAYFSQGSKRMVMKLVVAGELVTERTLHLARNYAPLIASFARRYVFGAGLEAGDDPDDPVAAHEREVSRQEVLAALFEVALTYQQAWGHVPGVLEARMQGVMTREFRKKGVSRVVGGVRQLTDKTEHSGDASLEPASDDQDEAQSPGGIEAMINTEGELGGARERGPARWQDIALEQVSIRELLDPLTEPQRRLALLLMEGLLPADAARILDVKPAAISQMIARMRPILAEVLSRRPQ